MSSAPEGKGNTMKSGPVQCSGDPASPFRMDPDRLEEVPADFTGPCLIELTYKHRSGRGRWWRPNSSGYTSVFVYAGVYSAEEARKICDGDDDVYPVDAMAALVAAEAEIRGMRERVLALVGVYGEWTKAADEMNIGGHEDPVYVCPGDWLWRDEQGRIRRHYGWSGGSYLVIHAFDADGQMLGSAEARDCGISVDGLNDPLEVYPEIRAEAMKFPIEVPQ